jgi:dienelactone hydrolase
MFGRNVYYYFPPADYRGLILFFHGSGSDAIEWLDLTERRRFFDEALAEGYAFLGFDSTNRNEKQWDLSMPPAGNPDLDMLQAILQVFHANGQLPLEMPIYSVGMSRGGRFASLAAYLLDMKATAIWVGLGHEDAMKITEIPTMWCLAAHDPIIDKDEVYAQYQQLLQRKVDTGYYVHPQMPIYPENFVGVEGIDRANSEQLFAELKSHGYLNDDYFLTENPRISRWEKHIGLNHSEAARLDIQDRLFVAFAEHTFYSDCDRSVLDFFDSHP